jgi:hypothetical protein
MSDIFSMLAPSWAKFWATIQFQVDFATAAIAVIAIWISRKASRNQERLNVETLRVQRDNDLINWTNGVIDTLVRIEFLLRDWMRHPGQFEVLRDGYLAELSAAIDKGRLYFPLFALDVIGPRSEPLPPVLTIPDRLVVIYDLIRQIDPQKSDLIAASRHELLLMKRAFMDHAQSEIDPQRRIKFLNSQ